MIRMFLARALCLLLKPFSFRGKGFLIHLVAPRQGQVQMRWNGLLLELDLSDHIQRSIYFGIYEPMETHWVKKCVKPGMVFVDVGANIGYFTLLASTLVGPEGRVVAFEPSPYACSKLRQTLEANDIHNVTLLQKGVAEKPGTVSLSIPPDSDGNHNPSVLGYPQGTPLEIEVVCLDQVCRELGVDRIDFLKLDVEGYEPNVLQGSAQLLQQRRIRRVLCEFNRPWLTANQTTPQALFDFLKEQGFLPVSGPLRPHIAIQNVYLEVT